MNTLSFNSTFSQKELSFLHGLFYRANQLILSEAPKINLRTIRGESISKSKLRVGLISFKMPDFGNYLVCPEKNDNFPYYNCSYNSVRYPLDAFNPENIYEALNECIDANDEEKRGSLDYILFNEMAISNENHHYIIDKLKKNFHKNIKFTLFQAPTIVI